VKRIALTLLFSGSMVCLPSLIEQANGSFRLDKTAIQLPINPAWEADPPSAQLLDVLSGPFTYLGRGMQSFVFESQDGKFVLKLFRRAPRIHPWRQFFRKNLLKRTDRRLPREKMEQLLNACKLAYTEAADLTGLVYIHLNPTDGLSMQTHLINRMGRKIGVDLNQCRFAIQKKGLSVSKTFEAAIRAKDLAKCERLTRSFISLVEERSSRNIRNLDKKLGDNFGFIGEQAIEWDFGSYALSPDLATPAAREKEIEIFRKHLRTFLELFGESASFIEHL